MPRPKKTIEEKRQSLRDRVARFRARHRIIDSKKKQRLQIKQANLDILDQHRIDTLQDAEYSEITSYGECEQLRKQIFVDSEPMLTILDNQKTHDTNVVKDPRPTRIARIITNPLGIPYRDKNGVPLTTEDYYIDKDGIIRPCKGCWGKNPYPKINRYT